MAGDELHSDGAPLQTVIQLLTEFAPLSYAESWDNVGLLVEPTKEILIKKILLTNDLTENVMDEALKIGTNLVVSYHPPLFVPIKKVTNSAWKTRILSKCLAHSIAIYSPHTTWDVVYGGVTDWLASPFDCSLIKPLQPLKKASNRFYIINMTTSDKFCFEEIQCKHPYMYSEKTPCFEILEKTVSNNVVHFSLQCTDRFVQTLDMILHNSPDIFSYTINSNPKVEDSVAGIGRLCTLKNEITIKEAVDKIKHLTGIPLVQLALARNANPESKIRTIGIVAGSGGSLLKNIKCDLKITGESSHHEVLDWIHDGSSVILTNHSNSERGFLKKFKEILVEKLKNPSISVVISNTDSDPLKVV